MLWFSSSGDGGSPPLPPALACMINSQQTLSNTLTCAKQGDLEAECYYNEPASTSGLVGAECMVCLTLSPL